jgi:hypothetical protein
LREKREEKKKAYQSHIVGPPPTRSLATSKISMRYFYYRHEKQCLAAGVAHTYLLKVASFSSANNL